MNRGTTKRVIGRHDQGAENEPPLAALLKNHRAFLRYLERRVDDRRGNAAVRLFHAREALKRRVLESCGVCADQECWNCSGRQP